MTEKCNAQRQITYWGEKNQATLEKSTVAIIGVGGLGSVAAELLCRMNIGTLLLCDGDVIANHNLSRQHLYTTSDVGKPKVVAAKEHLKDINPACKIAVFQEQVTAKTMDWCKDANIVLDCTDRHESRREIDMFCKKHNLPWVHGAAVREEGTVFVFLPERNITYEDIYGKKAKNFTCKELGVLATTTTLVGTWQVSFAVQYLLGRPVPDTLLRLYAQSGVIDRIKVSHKPL